MSAIRIQTLGGMTRALHEISKKCSDMLKAGKIPLIEVREESRKRSAEQNRLQRKWCKEAEEQGDMTAEEYRAYCKLHFGVPILRRDSEFYAEQYDRVIRWLPYEIKLECMAEPFDFAVTRLMNVKQKAEYLDKCYVHFTSLGFSITEPKRKAA